MLANIDKLLTGDLLKILCDMGHGDELVANSEKTERLFRTSGALSTFETVQA